MKWLHALTFAIFFAPALVWGLDCSGLPTSFTGNEFPNGDFFSNFDNSCYFIPFATGNGASKYGDLNATYYQMYYKVDPRYELVLVGNFPDARYFSVTTYDAHSATGQAILDEKIAPLTSAYINPFSAGQAYVAGQRYAIPISLGAVPTTTEPGCTTNGYNVDGNALDASKRHQGMDWNTDAGLFQAQPAFPLHIVDTARGTNPNTGGVVMVRVYLDAATPGYNTAPRLIVRDVPSGCAYPAAYVQSTLQIVSNTVSTGGQWLDHGQEQAHNDYESAYLPKLCYAPQAPPARLVWGRQQEYVPGGNPDAAYLVAGVSSGLPAKLAAAGQVMRIRFRVPSTPPTPCTNGCSRSGSEQMRYMSLSFLIPGGNTIASLADTMFTKDPNGYVTLVVGTGAAIPSWVTPANNYTLLDLTQLTGYDQLSLLDIRHMVPSSGFNCSGQFIAYRSGLSSPEGSLIGDYAPVVDYPSAGALPQVAAPLTQPGSCASFPSGSPGVLPNCAVIPPITPVIDAVVTQCGAAGCSRFVAQHSPPIVITGSGFGAFPEGEPFAGNSPYLEIANITRKWEAGYTGNRCTVSLSSWEDARIQLVANTGSGTGCPLASGDSLRISVWNPQTMLRTSLAVTAK